MTGKTCGTALPETAIILSVVLLVLLAAIQLAVIGFTQSAADGSAFVAAHSQAVAGPTSPPAPTVAQTAFPIVGTNVKVTSGSTTVQAVTSLTAGGLLMLPGTASSYSIFGGDVEPLFSSVAPGNGNFAFDANSTTLPSYCTTVKPPQQPTCNPGYAIFLAQITSYTKFSQGNGIGGTFALWTCHLNGYQAVPFPTSIGSTGYLDPNTGSIGVYGDPHLDPNVKNSAEYNIYSADSGKQNAGMNC